VLVVKSYAAITRLRAYAQESRVPIPAMLAESLIQVGAAPVKNFKLRMAVVVPLCCSCVLRGMCVAKLSLDAWGTAVTCWDCLIQSHWMPAIQQ
jgi:hypothetical protein